jgi:hypothetical protein
VGNAAILGNFLFQGGDFRSLDYLSGGQHASDAGFDLGLEQPILGLEVAQWNAPAAR